MAKTGCIFLEGTPDPLYPELLVVRRHSCSSAYQQWKMTTLTLRDLPCDFGERYYAHEMNQRLRSQAKKIATEAYVDSLRIRKEGDGVSITGGVYASQRKNQKPHQVWMHFPEGLKGVFNDARCSCKAG